MSLDTRITGNSRTRFLLEFFGNTAQFPIANIFLEVLHEGPAEYMLRPDLYTLLFGALVQAYFLSQWQTGNRPSRLLGNLIGPAVYSALEISLEGLQAFFAAPNHVLYWVIGLLIGSLQAIRPHLPQPLANMAQLLENLVRTSILLLMYVVFEVWVIPGQHVGLDTFLADHSHQFLLLTTLLLGVNAGLASLTSEKYLRLLRQTAGQLQTYSEWLLGRELLDRQINSAQALELQRHERTLLFMDIRGFTRWSEAHQPEQVVTLLQGYYAHIETLLNQHGAIKFKLSADEVLAIFAQPQAAVDAALRLQVEIAAYLQPQQLGAGIGLHSGPVIEGLLGSMGVRFYDVIGDTVNTAKRIESAAGSGEILLSAVVMHAASGLTAKEQREISVKGKEQPLQVYLLSSAVATGNT